MTQHDAHASLDDIRRMQNRTREEYSRHGFARPYVLVSAVLLFVMFASADLPRPWNAVVGMVVLVLAVALLVVHQLRAAVRRRPTGLELLFYVGAAAVLLTIFSAFQIGAFALGLPAPNVIAAAALALTSVAAARPGRRVFEAIMRREGDRG
ncbi:hypothetical protein [Sphaerisporangium sp. TRM90804]|uniref:hypothetical protein n=1 Tax=Sphaerisporangium sp. TRM90804 TaxID=3031113 RepID=UPI00244756E5|nr:hypothetical protein [Sphaerisporangium sp. TRM90804]MDH2425339.1 hypothetical protein [Sphaerisporangium sp. TRM90804]